jgi:flagellar biosynthesis/type III secretory pathway protein FliH
MSTSAAVLDEGRSVVRALLAVDPVEVARRAQSRQFVLPSISTERTATLEREAHERGFAQGEQAGLEAAQVRAELMLSRLVATIDEIAGLRLTFLRRAERDVANLAVAIAEHVLQREVSADPELLVEMARAAVVKLSATATVTIRMHPDDLVAVSSAHGAASDEGPIRFVADPRVGPGGCLVETPSGFIDAGITAQIREVLRAFHGDENPGRHGGDHGAGARS